MDGTQMSAKVAAKLVSAMGKMNGLSKEGVNSFHKYKYIRDTELINSARRVFAEVGLAFLVSLVNVEMTTIEKDKGKTSRHAVVKLQIAFICSESGESIGVLWQGEAIDESDKAINKAVVAGTKYALLRTLLQAEADEQDENYTSPETGRANALPHTGKQTWTTDEARDFVDYWQAQGMGSEDFRTALGATTTAGWKKTREEADAAMRAYIKNEVE